MTGAQSTFERGGRPPPNAVATELPTEPQQSPLTVLQLFTHTAGLMGGTTAPEARTLAEYARQTAALPLLFQPGTQFQYGEGISIIGRLIEVWSGQPYDVFLKEALFEPLEMRETVFRTTEENRHRLVTQYQVEPSGAGSGLSRLVDQRIQQGIPLSCGPDGHFPGPSGGVASTLGDYSVFMQMLCAGGVGPTTGVRILASSTVDFLSSNHLPAATNGGGDDCGDLAHPDGPGGSYSLINPGPGVGFGLGVAVRHRGDAA